MTQTLTDPEPQAVETPDGEVAAILARRVTQSKLGLTFAPETTFDEWQAAHGFFSGLKEHLNWWIGDSINFAEKSSFGQKYTQAIHITGKEYSTLTTIAAVCERITLDRRRALLPFSYHVEVAYLPYQEADFILDQAERQNWNRDDIREAVQKKTGITPKKRKSSGTAAKVAASGKTPELAEAHEVAPATKLGLFWNGHPLATSERLIYQANEKLDAPEADRAAHHHGFAHAEALVNWLEQNGFIRKEEQPCAPTTTPASAPVAQTPKASDCTCPTAQPEGASSGASQSDPETAPIAQPASPAPASAPSEPQAIKESKEPFREVLGMLIPESMMPPVKTPLEAAEEHILAFNAAAEKVDWPAVGKNALARKKWLGRLLAPADNAIDAIQGTPPTPRK